MSTDIFRMRHICFEAMKTNSFADRLKLSMDERSLNDRKLAIKMGVSPSTIGRYLRGGEIEGSTLVKLALALEVSVDWLLTGKGLTAQPGGNEQAILRIAEVALDDDLSRDIAKMKLLMSELPDDVREVLMQVAVNLREIRGQGKPLGRKKTE